jgi:VRR-NUC domain
MEIKMAKIHETCLQIQIVHLLRIDFPNLLFYHVPNGGLRNKREASKLKAMGVMAGVPDLVFHWTSNWIHMETGFIEIKIPKGRLMPAQIEFGDNIKAMGTHYAVCHSYEEVRATLISWGIRCSNRVVL